MVRQYVLPKIAEIRKYLPLDKNVRLLDVGCGNGFFSHYFSQLCDTVGVDFSRKMLEKNPVPQKLLMDAAHLAFQDLSFDVVFCHALLHHVENPDAVIREMRRVSRRYVVILEPNRDNPLVFLFSAAVPQERKALSFSMKFLRKRFEENKLKVVAAFSHGATVPNKTPLFVLPLTRLLDFRYPWGMTNVLIGEK